jgi:hypothetical protein
MISKIFTQTYKYYSNETAFNRANTLSEIQQIQEQIVSKASTNEQSPDKAQDTILDIVSKISKEATEQLHLNNQSELNISRLQANKEGAKAYLANRSPESPEAISGILKHPEIIAGFNRSSDSKFTETFLDIETQNGIEPINNFDTPTQEYLAPLMKKVKKQFPQL